MSRPKKTASSVDLMPWEEVALILGISTSQAWRIGQSALARMKGHLMREGIDESYVNLLFKEKDAERTYRREVLTALAARDPR